MRAGQLEQVGTPEEIYHEPRSAFVARFIGSANLLPVTVERAAGGRATVVLPGGRRAEAPAGARELRPGSAALLMVRPEWIGVGGEEPGPGRAGVPATCTDLVFQGAQLRCALRTPQGESLVAHVAPGAARHGVKPGTSLWASWDRDAARLLPPEPSESG
jgi:ABC-type Fe3+/spermidine/putrescine transport system ATPase subunit